MFLEWKITNKLLSREFNLRRTRETMFVEYPPRNRLQYSVFYFNLNHDVACVLQRQFYEYSASGRGSFSVLFYILFFKWPHGEKRVGSNCKTQVANRCQRHTPRSAILRIWFHTDWLFLSHHGTQYTTTESDIYQYCRFITMFKEENDIVAPQVASHDDYWSVKRMPNSHGRVLRDTDALIFVYWHTRPIINET